MSDPVQCAPRRWFWYARRILRGVRWCVWLFLLVVVGIIIYFYKADLPDSVKHKLEAKLRERGMDLQITHLKWDFPLGFLAKDVRFGPAQMDLSSPRLSLQEVELRLHRGALLHLKLDEVDSLVLTGGQFTWRLSDSNQPPETLALTNLQARLRLLPGDQWELSHFTAGFAGAKLQLAATVTNASAFTNWTIFQGHAPANPELTRDRLRRFVRAANLIQFAKTPELNVLIHGDARDPQSFSSEISLAAPATTTPWGTLRHGQLNARLLPPATNHGLTRAEFKLQADEADTRWGGAHQLHVELHAAGDETMTNLIHARLEILAAGLDTPWIQSTNAHFSAQWTHALTNLIPADGTVELLLTDTRTPWATADEVRLNGTLGSVDTNALHVDESWGWWANLAPCKLDWNCRFVEVRADDFESKELACSGSWRAPELTVTNLHSEMYRGKLNGYASLNVATRKAGFSCGSDFDLQKAYPFLTPEGRRWFQEQAFTWEKPPVVHANGSILLPPWKNRPPDWRADVRPSLQLEGDFAVAQGSCRQIPINSAQSHFVFSNQVWYLPDLVVVRPEGSARVALRSDMVSSNFYCHLNSRLDIKPLASLVENTNVEKALGFIRFTQPPVIEMEVWGRLHDYDRIGFKGRFALTNFTLRDESVSSFTGTLAYTNLFLLLTDARAERPEGYATVSAVGVDFPAKRAFLTNGYGNMEPTVLIHQLGPKISSDMEPYRHFAKPPTVSAYGVIPLSEDISMADMHFKIAGGEYQWLQLHSEHVAGTIDWVGKTMRVNIDQAEFYGGTLNGTAGFDFTKKIGSIYNFDMNATGANLARLMAGVTTSTNQLEGTLSGRLTVTQADSEDTNSWFGGGHVELKDGLIWDIPIFGVLTPVLDRVSPDLGKSRAREAKATFTINSSVMHSDDLEIRSPVLRIQYRGAVGIFDHKVDATAEAELGRDTPLVGPVVRVFAWPFTKLFECKVTGSLQDPKIELKHDVTKMMVSPITVPWRALKDLWNAEPAPTNPPPQFPPETPPAAPKS